MENVSFEPLVEKEKERVMDGENDDE